MEAIIKEHGALLRSKGFLIGVCGLMWTVKDFHLVNTKNPEGKEQTECRTENFYAGPKQAGRPDSIDVQEITDLNHTMGITSGDLSNALKWIGQGGRARDLHERDPKANRLTESITMSTIKGVCTVDDQVGIDIIKNVGGGIEGDDYREALEEHSYLAEYIN